MLLQLQRKRKKGTEKKFSVDIIASALDAVDSGLTLREATNKFGIPKSTIHNKLTNKTAINARKCHPTVLTESEENEIVNWMIFCGQSGLFYMNIIVLTFDKKILYII